MMPSDIAGSMACSWRFERSRVTLQRTQVNRSGNMKDDHQGGAALRMDTRALSRAKAPLYRENDMSHSYENDENMRPQNDENMRPQNDENMRPPSGLRELTYWSDPGEPSTSLTTQTPFLATPIQTRARGGSDLCASFEKMDLTSSTDTNSQREWNPRPLFSTPTHQLVRASLRLGPFQTPLRRVRNSRRSPPSRGTPRRTKKGIQVRRCGFEKPTKQKFKRSGRSKIKNSRRYALKARRCGFLRPSNTPEERFLVTIRKGGVLSAVPSHMSSGTAQKLTRLAVPKSILHHAMPNRRVGGLALESKPLEVSGVSSARRSERATSTGGKTTPHLDVTWRLDFDEVANKLNKLGATA